ncbi:MAG: histidine phosphatase family protein [Candidatus Nanosyncoccaceae bacterium]|jgi:broad specificity phosphatase PhoE
MSLYFIRHGESTANRDRVFAGHWDVDLTDLGEEQAIKAVRQAKLDNIQIDTIISSPLKRAYRTAELIALELGIQPDRIVVSDYAKERSGGEKTEGVPYEVLNTMTEDQVADFFSDGESDESVLERARDLLEFVMSYGDKNVLVVSHAGIGMRFLSVATGVSIDFNKFKIPNAQVIKVDVENIRNLI